MNALVVIPSYNERANIATLLDHILALGTEYSVCVVDDNSPDGTPEALRTYAAALPEDRKYRFQMIVRSKKDGRGGAVREGIRWGLAEDRFDAFIEMDADFSHPPSDLSKGIGLLSQADVVMGSRYPDGSIVGWPFSRRVFSWLANLLARILIDRHIADYTNGFRFYNKAAATYMCAMPQKHTGYIYLSETISYFLQAGFRIKEFPIVFVNRQRGKSNAGLAEVRRALIGIFMIAAAYRFSRSEHIAIP